MSLEPNQYGGIILKLCAYFSIAELTEFKQRRIAYFKKNFGDLVELELKHAKVCILNFSPFYITKIKCFLNLEIFSNYGKADVVQMGMVQSCLDNILYMH